MITLVQDSREQVGKQDHFLDYFESIGVKVVRTKLFVGDYSLLNDMSIVIDRKKDLLEMASNLLDKKNHERVREEMIRARDNNIKLIFLIEDEYIYNLDGVKYYKIPRYKGNQYQVINGVNILTHKRGEPRSQMNPETLGKVMATMEVKYGCKFEFATHDNYGKRILELLNVK